MHLYPYSLFIRIPLLGTEFFEGLRAIATKRVVKSKEAMSLATTKNKLSFSK